jgi:hypothetical protein
MYQQLFLKLFFKPLKIGNTCLDDVLNFDLEHEGF